MVALVGFGLDAIFSRFPALLPTMRYLGAAYMLWLAWKIARSGPLHDGERAARRSASSAPRRSSGSIPRAG